MSTSVSPRASRIPADDPLLARFRAALDELYGDRLERVTLFGSRARGDFHADSDYDVAVFLRAMPDRWDERRRLADLRAEFIDATSEFFDVKPFLASEFRDRTPIMSEIRRDGRDF